MNTAAFAVDHRDPVTADRQSLGHRHDKRAPSGLRTRMIEVKSVNGRLAWNFGDGGERP